MILCIGDLLDNQTISAIQAALVDTSFLDGRQTAGWHARLVKDNEQADGRSPGVQRIKAQIESVLAANPLFQMASRPKRLSPIIISRYRSGMHYGNHVDDPLMGGGDGRLRTDLSFTLFLSDPSSYEGGELVTDTTAGEQSWKLAAGSLVLYPSSTLHRVEPVTTGVRLAAVGWIQSLIRDPAHREILFDLDTVRRQLFERDGKSREFDLITKSLANLQRQWVEI